MNLSLFPPFFHDLSFSKLNKHSGVKRQKSSTKVCGLIFHQCFSYSSSSNCLLWIMSQKLVQMSKKNWRREPSSRLYLGFLQSFELFYGCFQSRDQQQPVIEDLVISWPFFSRTMRNIWSYYIFIFFRFAPSGSSFLCPREGHLQTCTRGAHKAGRRGEGYTLLESSHRHELSFFPAAGELWPFPPRILHRRDIKGLQRCRQGERLRNKPYRMSMLEAVLGFFT